MYLGEGYDIFEDVPATDSSEYDEYMKQISSLKYSESRHRVFEMMYNIIKLHKKAEMNPEHANEYYNAVDNMYDSFNKEISTYNLAELIATMSNINIYGATEDFFEIANKMLYYTIECAKKIFRTYIFNDVVSINEKEWNLDKDNPKRFK